MTLLLLKLGVRDQTTPETAPYHHWVLPDGSLWTRFFRLREGYLIRFPDLADFEVSSDGSRVQYWSANGVAEETVALLFNNQVRPLALSRQGKLMLHASSVALEGEAVAFVGPSGRGKSTLAASFATHGFPCLTDDGLQVEIGEDFATLLPSLPSLRLWDDSLRATISADAPRIAPGEYSAKSRVLAGEHLTFHDAPMKAGAFYFLGEGDSAVATFEPLRQSEALIEMVRHSFLLDVEQHEILKSNFTALSRLVSITPCFRLDYPRNYDALAEVRLAIVEHSRAGETV